MPELRRVRRVPRTADAAALALTTLTLAVAAAALPLATAALAATLAAAALATAALAAALTLATADSGAAAQYAAEAPRLRQHVRRTRHELRRPDV